MRYLVSASEMRRLDHNTIEKIGIPACVLMERAALAAVEAVVSHGSGGSGPVLVMAGMGNNGGDGLAAARLLAERGYEVEVWCVGEETKASEQWRRQREILTHYPAAFTETPDRREYQVMIDALFGVGLSREVSGGFAEAVSLFNSLKGWKLALDIPSGIDSDTGSVLGCAVRADRTVTFGFCKRGLALYPGCRFSGEVQTADIGVSERSFFGEEPELYAYDEPEKALLPERAAEGNKGTFGKILLAAGSVNMAGAAVLAAKAAYRAGAGMVKVISPPENRIILQQSVPEALFGVPEEMEAGLEWADVIAVGPGIGRGKGAEESLEKAVRLSGKPLLADADGLNILAENQELRTVLAAQGAKGREIILTPHAGELARLMRKELSACKADLLACAHSLAAECHAVVAAKDARTFICGEMGRACVNLSGSSGMATAGSGDVLSGIVSALLAQGMKAFDAAAVGAYVHGRAGERAAQALGERACMAGDLSAFLADEA